MANASNQSVVFSAYSTVVPDDEQPLFLIAAILSSLLAMFITALFASDMLVEDFLALKTTDWLLALAMGFLVDAMGYIMWVRSLHLAIIKNINVSKLASIIFILPLLSLIIVALLYKENTILNDYFIISFVILITGIWLAQVKLLKKTN
jgi:drug/metabolite transporter (DMT)-like permease